MSQRLQDELQEALNDYERTDKKYKRAASVFFITFFVVTATVIGYMGVKMLPNPLEVSNGIDKFATDYTALKRDNEDLKKKVNDLEKAVANDSTNVNTGQLEARVDTLETESKNISDTILENPDRAISTRLLREKQIAMDDAIKSTQIANTAVNARLDSIFMTLVAAPVIGAVLAGIGTLIVSYYSRKKRADLKRN